MTQSDKKPFIPSWRENPPVSGSYRSIFKWGDPRQFKHPTDRLYFYMRELFSMTDESFRERIKEGDNPVKLAARPRLEKKHINALSRIVGDENVAIDDYSRVRFASGKTIEEAIRLRSGEAGPVADAVVHPRSKDDVCEIVSYCHKNAIPIYAFGAGSSVNFGPRPMKGGISLVLSTHMNRIISLNEENQTVTVQPGMFGKEYESHLNNACDLFGTKHPYTCGHFPQSFEYSSVGGWVLTLGSGQQSSYYGDAADLVISQEYVTPQGTIITHPYPASANGPSIDHILMGSEGSFGILVEVTMKVFRYMPENASRFAFIFPSWEEGIKAVREISQGEFGMPSVMRLSDPEETDIGLKLYGVEGSPIDAYIKLRGYKPMQRCLFLGRADGEKGFAGHIKKMASKICRAHGGMSITGFPVRSWEHGRFQDPYLREDLHDYGIITDTLETSVTWENLHHVHRHVREIIKNKPNTVCMTHSSHFYPQGTNLYFIFMFRAHEVNDYISFQDSVIDAIIKNGGSPSHHHGVGKMIAPWMEEYIGHEGMQLLRAIKKHLDPKNIMNPGGQMGLDLKGKKWRWKQPFN